MGDEFFGKTIATLQLGASTLCLRDYAASAELPMHAHGRAFVTMVVNGGFRESWDDQSTDCVTHDLVVHAPGVRHRNHFIARTTRCLTVLGRTFERTLRLAGPAVTGIALKLLREFRAPDALSPMVVDALMDELFVTSERQTPDVRAPRWLADVCAIIDRRFNEPLTLRELAELVGVHPGHLARAFRHHEGRTVGERIRDRRVNYARARMQSGAPLAEIAHDAGFSDQSHLTRVFRRATGLTPAHYRRMLGPS